MTDLAMHAQEFECVPEQLVEIDLSPTPRQHEFMGITTSRTHGEQVTTALTSISIFGIPVGQSGPTAITTGHGTVSESGAFSGASGTALLASGNFGGGSASGGSTGGPPSGPSATAPAAGGGAPGGGAPWEPLEGPPGASGQQAVGEAGAVPFANGPMKGHAPECFDGQRKNAAKFMGEFRLWRICNIRNESMINPFQRIALVLTYMKGPKVDDWVRQQGHKLEIRVLGNHRATPPTPPTHHDTDEALWTDFVTDFERAFMDTASEEQAYADLTKLEMKDDEIDGYIAAFEHLLMKAGWKRNDPGSPELFKQGLPKPLHWMILQRDPIPRTLDEWEAAARREVQRRKLALASLGPRRGKPGWREGGGLSENEPRKLQAEGRCYVCTRQGHFRRDCPMSKRSEDTGEGGLRTGTFRMSTVDQEREGGQRA